MGQMDPHAAATLLNPQVGSHRGDLFIEAHDGREQIAAAAIAALTAHY